VVLVTLAVQ